MNKKRIVFASSIVIFIILGCIVLSSRKSENVEHRLQWWLENIGWDEERNQYDGKGVKVAIIDTGVDFSHQDLKKCKHSQRNIVRYSIQNREHGTAIAGIISAYPHNNKGVLGIAPKTELISINVTNGEYVKEENLIKGINTAIEEKVDIINISVGVKEASNELHECIKKAYKNNIIIVASAGNYMKKELLFPAAYSEVLAVGSYDKNGNIMSPKNNIKNVIYLPGKNIVTTISNNKYTGVQGTSFSTAILSGIITLVKEQRPDVENEILYKRIRKLSNIKENKITVTNLLKEMEDKE